MYKRNIVDIVDTDKLREQKPSNLFLFYVGCVYLFYLCTKEKPNGLLKFMQQK